MNRNKLSQMLLIFFVAFSFFFCTEDELINQQPDQSDARARIKPKANAGNDIAILLPTNSVKLDGSNSKDSLGSIKSYLWTKVSGPASFVIKNPSNAITDITDLIEGSYIFKLTVTNDKNAKASDDVLVTVGNSTVLAGTALPTVEDLYFSGNMDNVTIIPGSEAKFSGWDNLVNHPYVRGLYLNNVGGSSYAWQEIRKDPVTNIQNVLYGQVLDDDPNVSGTTRAQTTIVPEKGIDLPILHTSHRMFLNPDIAYLSNYEPYVGWFTLYEIWNWPNSEWAGSTTGSCRWNLSFFKEKGVGQPLFWHAEAEYMQPSSENYMWRVNNKAVPIPFGKWFTLDLYMKRGEGSNGRFTVKITVDGVTSTIFDVANTTIYPGHPEIQIGQWQIFKLYTGDPVLDWMRSNNKKISAYYNDFKWYKN